MTRAVLILALVLSSLLAFPASARADRVVAPSDVLGDMALVGQARFGPFQQTWHHDGVAQEKDSGGLLQVGLTLWPTNGVWLGVVQQASTANENPGPLSPAGLRNTRLNAGWRTDRPYDVYGVELEGELPTHSNDHTLDQPYVTLSGLIGFWLSNYTLLYGRPELRWQWEDVDGLRAGPQLGLTWGGGWIWSRWAIVGVFRSAWSFAHGGEQAHGQLDVGYNVSVEVTPGLTVGVDLSGRTVFKHETHLGRSHMFGLYGGLFLQLVRFQSERHNVFRLKRRTPKSEAVPPGEIGPRDELMPEKK